MGMAASQARYLALVARKSNCEYEGQQINQARLALSNQSANLFNQMLGLTVPVPPSTQDFTKKQYSFSDGINVVTLDTWKQLATKDENYNYVVTYHYNADVYTGSQKKMNDPQVQFTYPDMEIPTDYISQVNKIQAALVELNEATEAYNTAESKCQSLKNAAKNLNTYADRNDFTGIKNAVKEGDNYKIESVDKYLDPRTNEKYDVYNGNDDNTYYYKNGIYYYKDGEGNYTQATPLTQKKDPNGNPLIEKGDDNLDYYVYADSQGISYYYNSENKTYYSKIKGEGSPEAITAGSAAAMDAKKKNTIFTPYVSGDNDTTKALNIMKKYGAIDENIDLSTIYICEDGTFAFKSDIEELVGLSGTATILPVYNYQKAPAEGETWKSAQTVDKEISDATVDMNAAKMRLDTAQLALDSLDMPDYIGNCKVTPLSELTETDAAEISQVIKDMTAQDVQTNLSKYYNPDSGEYTGGIYKFTYNGITYYTTYDDLSDSALSGTGINHIDDQQKLPYYNADYVSTKIDKTEKALLETDANGRFTSIRLEDDSVKYNLNVETITDDMAYQDAMNKYYYENALYDKMVQDINAKTSLIHQEDRQLELRLKQLDTEQNALKTEMDAVQKVVKDNVDSTFKTFNN